MASSTNSLLSDTGEPSEASCTTCSAEHAFAAILTL
jgi:hypothetical protein